MKTYKTRTLLHVFSFTAGFWRLPVVLTKLLGSNLRTSHTLSVKLLLARELCSAELDKPHQSLWLSTVVLIYYDLGTSNTRSWVQIPVIAHSDKTMQFTSLWIKARCINESKCKSKSVKHHLASPLTIHRKLIKQEMTSNSILNPTSIIMDFLMTLQSESRTIT